MFDIFKLKGTAIKTDSVAFIILYQNVTPVKLAKSKFGHVIPIAINVMNLSML